MSRSVQLRFIMRFAAAVNLLVPIWITWSLFTEPFAIASFIWKQVVLLFLVFVGRWDTVGIAFRCVSALAVLLAAGQKGDKWACTFVIVTLITTSVLVRFHRGNEVVDLRSPLRGGTYYVVQGGDSAWVNHHRRSASQRFALDVVALNSFGTRARGIYPRQLDAYKIFGDTVYSPCSGIVTATKNDLPDLLPSHMDQEHIAGNYIVISVDHGNLYVGLCHLMKYSLTVQPGDRVHPGQILARVGNSGNTSEPHLHIHVKRGGKQTSILDGKGVPIRFNGRWLIRGDFLRESKTKC